MDPGGTSDFTLAINGVANFVPGIGAAGTVSFTGTGTSVSDGGAGASNQTCSGDYVVSNDGSFTLTLNCNLAFTQGINAPSGTATVNGIDLAGQLTLDGTVVLLRNAIPNIETFQRLTDSAGAAVSVPSTDRICNASGVATSRR